MPGIGPIRNPFPAMRTALALRMLGASWTTSPVTVTFPAAPEYLRLARIATADAASRAGLDYEEIDDVRIAVSELCSVVSVDPAATVTLAFLVSAGKLTVDGEARTGSSDDRRQRALAGDRRRGDRRALARPPKTASRASGSRKHARNSDV